MAITNLKDLGSLNGKQKLYILETTQHVTKANKNYLRFKLLDEGGNRFDGIMFNVDNLAVTPANDMVIEVEGAFGDGDYSEQFKIQSFKHLVNADDSIFKSYLEDIKPKAKFSVEEMDNSLREIFRKNIKKSYFLGLCNLFFNGEYYEAFKAHPAGKSVHHSYANGLLEHTLSVCQLAEKVADHYAGEVNKELILLGALFHDIGKLKEINAGDLTYGTEGQLLGHIMMSIMIVEKYIEQISDFPEEMRTLLLHIIASHHGELEYGAIKKPLCKEAFIVSHCDNIDAKVNALMQIFKNDDVKEGEWTKSSKNIFGTYFFNHGLI